MNPKEIEHEVLTVKEICDLLQVHPSTVYKLVRQGKIPSFRVGNDWRFHRDVIVRWMVEKSTSPASVIASSDLCVSLRSTARLDPQSRS